MKKTIALFALLMVGPVANSFALDRCESDFRRGLSEMKSLFNRLSPACQAQVNLGEGNQRRIQEACTGSGEIDTALQMKSIKLGTLRPLCVSAECKGGRLAARGVCVEGKPFKYYLSKFDM
jgi:hypothetical protein